MRRGIMRWSIVTLFVCAGSAGVYAQQIRGDYVETRSADVWTGPCYANAEMGLSGDQAILAWHVERGEWDGVRLDGLTVVGVIKARATLGDPTSIPYPAKAVVIVDERARPDQKTALVRFAQTMAGPLLTDIVRVETAPIAFFADHEGGHYGRVTVRAGSLAMVQTRALSERDHLCGNEEVYYPPLTPLSHAMPAVAAVDQYQGPDLGSIWSLHGKRSAFVGSFAR